MRVNVWAALAATVIVTPGTTLAAQDRSQDTKATPIPEAAMPPAGMCRVWLRDVPERQQPAPTDCATAIRMMPRDAMVVFGDLKRAARVSPVVAAPPAGRSNAARDVPGYRGPGIVAGDARGAQLQGRGPGVTGVSATVPGGAAAVKAPETKAPIKPEKPQ